MKRNIKEATKAAPILCQAVTQVIFHPEATEFSPNILMEGEECPTLPDSVEAAYTSQALTNTPPLTMTHMQPLGASK